MPKWSANLHKALNQLYEFVWLFASVGRLQSPLLAGSRLCLLVLYLLQNQLLIVYLVCAGTFMWFSSFLFEVTTTLMVLGYRALCFQVCCIVFRHIVADVQACTLLFVGPDSFVCTPSDLVTLFTFDFIVLVILI